MTTNYLKRNTKTEEDINILEPDTWLDQSIRKQQPEEYFSLKFETRSFVAFNTPDTMSYLEKDIGQQMYTGISIEVHIWTGIGIFYSIFTILMISPCVH